VTAHVPATVGIDAFMSTTARPLSPAASPDAGGPEPVRPPPGWVALFEVASLGLLLGLLVWNVWTIIEVPALLGHDESVYAAQGRHWIAGTPDTAWGEHRAPLLAVLGAVIQLATDSERALRLTGLAAGAGSMAAVWWLARSGVLAARPEGPSGPARLGAAVAGLTAAGAVITIPLVVQSAGSFLTDLPAAALLTAVAALLWRAFERAGGPSWGLVWVAPLAAAAFYMRYGAALYLLLLGLTALLIWLPGIRRRPAPVLVTGAVFAVLLVPHVLSSMATFGTPWGRIRYTGELVASVMDEPGLPTYLAAYPGALAGWPADALMMLGAAALVAALVSATRRRAWDAPRRLAVFLTLPALVYLVVIGLRATADVRFLFPALLLLLAAGGMAAGRVTAWGMDRLGRPGPYTAVAVLGVLLLLSLPAMDTARARAVTAQEEFGEVQEPVRQLGLEIGRRSDPDCFVATSYAPQIIWYSACAAISFDLVRADELRGMGVADRWVALFHRGKRQPEGIELQRYLAPAGGQPEIVIDSEARLSPAEAYRVRVGP
jgi:4-amino-4-deoxy-L-arabinose transferase-like glycosyltransferase